jgi:hypothetical protein
MGLDPVAERRRRQLREITLETAFEDFKRARKNLKPKTLYDNDRTLRIALPRYLQRSSPMSGRLSLVASE